MAQQCLQTVLVKLCGLRTAHRSEGFRCPNQFSSFVVRMEGQMEDCFPPTKLSSSQMCIYRDSLSYQINWNGGHAEREQFWKSQRQVRKMRLLTSE